MRRMLETSAAFKLPGGLQKERVQWLYDGAAKETTPSTAQRHLLYWMQTSVRSKYNHALEFAIAAANALALPLHVVYLLSDRSVVPQTHFERDPNAFGFATERHAKFGLEGLRAVQQRLHKRGLSFQVLHHAHSSTDSKATAHSPTRSDLIDLCARDAVLVVTDRPYLHPWRNALTECVDNAENNERAYGVVQVESDIVVPCGCASDKEEYAARTIRPKITKQLSKFVVPLDHLEVSDAARTNSSTSLLTKLHAEAEENSGALLKPLDVTEDIESLLSKLDLDRSVRAVSTFTGGEDVAVELAKSFLEKKLAKYADDRNEPSGDAGSNLSLYLRFGHISPVRIAVAAKKVTSAAAKAGKESFLEEMIVRRELSINMAVYNKHYDSMQCLPEYAKITLKEHAGDKREHLYTQQQLEAGKSFDVYWNAAQLEMVATGKMHGYMRMYWGKKILEWTESPEEGYRIALFLNNKYCLDAPDPNSYTGIAWTFGYVSYWKLSRMVETGWLMWKLVFAVCFVQETRSGLEGAADLWQSALHERGGAQAQVPYGRVRAQGQDARGGVRAARRC